MFCPELQRLLKPIYDLTRKGRQFMWEREQHEAFKEIKQRLIKEGRVHLYSYTSKFATGSTLYQIQIGKPRLIADASKRLPETVRSYLTTE